jgi:hypothetical protein
MRASSAGRLGGEEQCGDQAAVPLYSTGLVWATPVRKDNAELRRGQSPSTCRSFAGTRADADYECSNQPVGWLIRVEIAASKLYGPAPAKMTTINMTAYKVSGR